MLQQAYVTLSDPTTRKAYDAALAAGEARLTSGPRPAQVVSLEEFSAFTGDNDAEYWTYACRCGGAYHIDDTQLEADVHMIGCDSCSEVIWVGYEVESEDVKVDAQQEES